MIRRTVQALNALLNGGSCAKLQEGKKAGGGVVKKSARFVLKIRLDGQLDSHLDAHCDMCNAPFVDRKT